MKRTEEESGVYRWREIEQCQQLALSQLKYPDWGGMPQESWAELDLNAVLDEVAKDYDILNAQLTDVSEGHSGERAFWEFCNEDYANTDFEVPSDCATPAHDGLASSTAPRHATRDHPDLTFSRDLWTFRDRGYDEWFDEEDPEGQGEVQDEFWEETGAATALNRLDPWRDYILPKSAGARLPPWDLVHFMLKDQLPPLPWD